MSAYGGGWPYTDLTIVTFVASERDRHRRGVLRDSVLPPRQADREAPADVQSRPQPHLGHLLRCAVSTFVDDLETYKRLVENRTLDQRTSRVGRPPKLVTEWTADEL